MGKNGSRKSTPCKNDIGCRLSNSMQSKIINIPLISGFFFGKSFYRTTKIFACFKFDCSKKWTLVELGTIRNPKLVFPLFRHPLVSNLLSPRGYNVLEVRPMWVTKGGKTDYRFQRMDIDAWSIKYSRLSLPYLFTH